MSIAINSTADNIVTPVITPTAKVVAPSPDYMRPELAEKLAEYKVIEDAIAGEIAVKKAGATYLPRPNAADTSPGNLARYSAYLMRAVFYNVAKRTLSGLSGQVFAKDAVVKVPALLDIVIKDANGSGVSLEQISKDAEDYVLAYGRAGVLADYPKTEGPATVAQQRSGDIRPTITVYKPWHVINWRTMTRKARVILSLVVIRESYDQVSNDFGGGAAEQLRVLKLVDNIYRVEIWRNDTGAWRIFDSFVPKDGRGNPINEIPFTFIGSVNNDATVDPAPMYDICSLNLAHYRNSADYEESCFITGQATPVITGVTKDWVDTVLMGTVELGSRAAISLPVGGDAKLLQMEANSAPFEAMQHKERQMVALGAKLVQETAVARTATEANIEQSAETSILSSVTKNVSAAMKWSLEWCAIFMNLVSIDADARSNAVTYELSTDFSLASMTPEQQTKVIEMWVKNAISWTEMRAQLKRTGLASQDDAKAKAEISADAEEAMKREGLLDDDGNATDDTTGDDLDNGNNDE